jgi:hypothetical protein
MIVQTAESGQSHFIITQRDHAFTSGQFARAFGNAHFAGLEPYEPMVFMVEHHDEGWAETDAHPKCDPRTGLPYHLTQTPLPDLVKIGAKTPDFNEAHHPYSGLISSMHTYGLYHGRYGLSDKVFIDVITPDHRPAVEAMLNGELERQTRLKARVDGALPTDDVNLFHNYKLLQFFDTLALYFQMTHEAARGDTQFGNVPMRVGQDVTITLRVMRPGVVSLDPYPFTERICTATTDGRYLSPTATPDIDMRELLYALPLERQTYIIQPHEQ